MDGERHGERHRIAYLDGLRGCAVLLVMGWHYAGPSYARFLPYGDAMAWLMPFSFGWVGVELFFLISGYVIFLTLERCSGFLDFLLRRLVRLWPAMLAASLVIFAVSQAAGPLMPDGRHAPIDLLPGLTFVDPFFWHALVRRPIQSIDGVFWTLYIEMGFYVVIGLLYFRLGWRGALAGLVLLWLAVWLAEPLLQALPPGPWQRADEPFKRMGMLWYLWFASGGLFLKARETRSDRLFVLAIAIGFLAAATFTAPVPIGVMPRTILFGCVMLFAAAERWDRLQHWLGLRPLLFLGAISYPLYLLHSQLGIALIGWMGRGVPLPLAFLLPVPASAAMVALAWGIARFVERPLMRRLRRLLDAGRRRGENDPGRAEARTTCPVD